MNKDNLYIQLHNGSFNLAPEDFAIILKENGEQISIVPDHNIHHSIGEFHWWMILLLFSDTEETIAMQEKLRDMLISKIH